MTSFLTSFGYTGLFFIILAETSLFAGFFLPGDTLLLAAGLLASSGYLQLIPLIVIAFIGAVLGDSIGYALGKKYGHRIFSKENSVFFRPEHRKRAERFFEKHGGKTVILARFVPVIRTAAPILAGVGKMHYGVFLIYNVVGAALWTVGITLFGYYLGNLIPRSDAYIFHIILVALLSLVFLGIARVVLKKKI